MCPNSISEVSELISSEKNSNIKRNDYKNYDNILTPNSIASDYYKSKGRYDLVPINLNASDIIDYQVCSPNMYQSSQCKGQFIYSRFRNVSDTFDMYANTLDKNGSAKFDSKAEFMKSENTYHFKNNNKDNNFWIERFNFFKPSGEHGYKGEDITSITDEQKKALFNYIIELYDYQTGSSLSSVSYYSEEDVTLYMWKKYGETEKAYAARNIITNKMPNVGDINSNKDISIVGIYYSDSNSNIYIGRKKNYTNIENYENGIFSIVNMNGIITE